MNYERHIKLNLIPLACLVLSSLSSPTVLAESFIKNGYPTADSFLGEALQENEHEYAHELLEVIKQKIESDYFPGIVKRDEHTKSHGCVDARFTVRSDLPSEFKQGIFSKPTEYKAKIRFSNSSPDSQADDIEKDGRGFALKLFGVEGDKITSPPLGEDHQDFILLSVPFFFINSAKDYKKTIDVKDNGSKLQQVELVETIGLKGTKNILKFFSAQIANPLEQQYYSAVPYRLGADKSRMAVKYSVKQCAKTSTPLPEKPTRNYLRNSLQETLLNGGTCLEFMVQKKVGDEMFVENSNLEWQQQISPFVTVARIDIPKQEFNTAEKNSACENLSFNPWHSIAEHKPLGSVNRVRYVVYEGISELRHKMNGLD